MKAPKASSNARAAVPKTGRHGVVAVLGILLLPAFFLVVLKTGWMVTSGLDLQISSTTSTRIHAIEEQTSMADEPNPETEVLPLSSEDARDNMTGTFIDAESRVLAVFQEEKGTENMIFPSQPHWEQENTVGNTQLGVKPEFKDGKREHVDIVPERAGETQHKRSITCDFSSRRSDTCVMEGDSRVLPHFSTVLLVKDLQQGHAQPQNSWKVKPYTRKWEEQIMELIKEVTVKGPVAPQESPRCDTRHAMPTVIFSTGGFAGNFFHDFTDVLIPLFITSRQYNGEVRFLVTNYNAGWINKYQHILKKLSRYDILNMDWEGQTHCFPKAHVGLVSHKELGIDRDRSPNGYSMADFRELLRETFSLRRRSASLRGSRRPPRLLIIHRKGSRSMLNKDEVATTARRVGYKVVLAGPEKTSNVARFARVVNSCDVMMGVHGAGLTNMVFLPRNATLIQVVPWGALRYACRHAFCDPALDMGIKYMEYEVGEEESSLTYQYPRDHTVFTDPLSIHRQGWNALWYVFLHRQQVRLDVRRFRGVLQDAMPR